MHDLILKSQGPHPKDIELYLDDLRISGIQSYELRASVGGVNHLSLELVVRSINNDTNVLKMLVDQGAITK